MNSDYLSVGGTHSAQEPPFGLFTLTRLISIHLVVDLAFWESGKPVPSLLVCCNELSETECLEILVSSIGRCRMMRSTGLE